MSLAAFLETFVQVLEDVGVPYMLTGSLAAAYYAAPRATQDADIVIEVAEAQLDRVAEGLLARGFYVSREAAREALNLQGQFNAIDAERGWKVDFIIRKDRPFSREELARRRRVNLLGVDIPIATIEDLIVAKLEWAKLADSELQRRDARHLVEAGGDGLERNYIERWVEELGLQQEWAKART